MVAVLDGSQRPRCELWTVVAHLLVTALALVGLASRSARCQMRLIAVRQIPVCSGVSTSNLDGLMVEHVVAAGY